MQDHIEKLVVLDEKLDWIEGTAEGGQASRSCVPSLIRDARQLLQSITDLLRRDYGQIARARDEAIGMLTYLRDEHLAQPCCVGSRDQLAPHPKRYRLSLPDRNRITQIIALLEGAAEEGEDEAER